MSVPRQRTRERSKSILAKFGTFLRQSANPHLQAWVGNVVQPSLQMAEILIAGNDVGLGAAHFVGNPSPRDVEDSRGVLSGALLGRLDSEGFIPRICKLDDVVEEFVTACRVGHRTGALCLISLRPYGESSELSGTLDALRALPPTTAAAVFIGQRRDPEDRLALDALRRDHDVVERSEVPSRRVPADLPPV